MNIRKSTLMLLCTTMMSSTALATPMFTGFISDGMLPNNTSDHFTLTNNSNAGETITKITFDISSTNLFFDTSNVAPGNIGNDFMTNGASDTVGETYPATAISNGSQSVDITFSNFDASETFIFGADFDDFGDIDGTHPDVSDLFGTTMAIMFSDGTTLLGEFIDTNSQGFGAEWSQVPEPSALSLLGLGLLAFGYRNKEKMTREI
ncbi:PEP-CTERM sorting domain-containing protein [Photobacterium sanctipauli]|nr:PEP-CTERM sorting domain-containing protein [Photobacterium sanctipauli]